MVRTPAIDIRRVRLGPEKRNSDKYNIYLFNHGQALYFCFTCEGVVKFALQHINSNRCVRKT